MFNKCMFKLYMLTYEDKQVGRIMRTYLSIMFAFMLNDIIQSTHTPT